VFLMPHSDKEVDTLVGDQPLLSRARLMLTDKLSRPVPGGGIRGPSNPKEGGVYVSDQDNVYLTGQKTARHIIAKVKEEFKWTADCFP
jgi:hypothetical protein